MGQNNEGNESKQMQYWNEARVKTMSTNSRWLEEVYEDAILLMEVSKERGVSDLLRLRYTERAIEALTEAAEYLKPKKKE